MGETVTRLVRAEVPRCEAQTKSTRYRPEGGRCPYQAMVELDGEQLCKKHADLWAQAAHEAQQEPANDRG